MSVNWQKLGHDPDFVALFNSDDSPVKSHLSSLRTNLLQDQTLSEKDRAYKQGLYKGILSVVETVRKKGEIEQEQPAQEASVKNPILRGMPRTYRRGE